MKKLLLLSIIFLTGCSVEYNLSYYNDVFSESIDVVLPKTDPLYSSRKEELVKKNVYVYSDQTRQEYYKKDSKNLVNSFVMNYNHNYDFLSFRSSRALNECFEIAAMTYDDDNIYISTQGKFKCLNFNNEDLEEVKFIFTTNHKLKNNNADITDNNSYTWIFNKDNLDKKIEITIDKDEFVADTSWIKPFLISVGIIITLAAIIALIYFYRFKKVDKI